MHVVYASLILRSCCWNRLERILLTSIEHVANGLPGRPSRGPEGVRGDEPRPIGHDLQWDCSALAITSSALSWGLHQVIGRVNTPWSAQFFDGGVFCDLMSYQRDHSCTRSNVSMRRFSRVGWKSKVRQELYSTAPQTGRGELIAVVSLV